MAAPKADTEYPALLHDLRELVAQKLLEIGVVSRPQAEAIGDTVSEHAMEHFGGVPQYWPKGQSWRQQQRRKQMWAAFNGHNHADLAKQYGMCLQQVYKWLAVEHAEQRKAQQPDLFAAGNASNNPEREPTTEVSP